MAGMKVKLRARYRLGEEPGVLGRNYRVGIPVVDRCRDLDGTEIESPRPGKHPQVLGNSPAAAAERLGITGQEGLAHARPLQPTAVDAGQLACGQAKKQFRAAAGQVGEAAEEPAAERGSVPRGLQGKPLPRRHPAGRPRWRPERRDEREAADAAAEPGRARRCERPASRDAQQRRRPGAQRVQDQR